METVWSQRAHVVLIVTVALGALIFSYVLAEFAFSWFGAPCRCVSTKFLGTLCSENCISFGGVSLTEGPTKVVLIIVLPMVGTVIAESVLRAGSKGYED